MVAEKQYKEGHFIAVGIAIGIPLGIPLGLILGNIALGPAIGLPIGLIAGWLMEKKWNKNPIPLSEFEKSRQKRWSWVGIVIGLIVLTALTIFYFLSK